MQYACVWCVCVCVCVCMEQIMCLEREVSRSGRKLQIIDFYQIEGYCERGAPYSTASPRHLEPYLSLTRYISGIPGIDRQTTS